MLEMQSQATESPPSQRPAPLASFGLLLTGSYLPIKSPSYGPEYNSDASSL